MCLTVLWRWHFKGYSISTTNFKCLDIKLESVISNILPRDLLSGDLLIYYVNSLYESYRSFRDSTLKKQQSGEINPN